MPDRYGHLQGLIMDAIGRLMSGLSFNLEMVLYWTGVISSDRRSEDNRRFWRMLLEFFRPIFLPLPVEVWQVAGSKAEAYPSRLVCENRGSSSELTADDLLRFAYVHRRTSTSGAFIDIDGATAKIPKRFRQPQFRLVVVVGNDLDGRPQVYKLAYCRDKWETSPVIGGDTVDGLYSFFVYCEDV